MEEAAHFVADDFVWIHPAPVPKVEGKNALLALGADWSNILTIIHGIQAIWCTDDGWVNVILNEAWTAYNADKSKIVSGLEPRMGRVHINDENKIDQVYFYWDTSKVMPKLMSTADDNA
jgi:hypothetical protein